MSRLRPIWCSPGSLESGAVRGACAGSADVAALGRVPHGEQTAVVWGLLKAAQRGDIELQAGGNGDVASQPGHRGRTPDGPGAESQDAAAGRFAKAAETEGSRISPSWGP